MVQAMLHGLRFGSTTRDLNDGVVRAHRRHVLLLHHPGGMCRRDGIAKELVDEGEDAITRARVSAAGLECILIRCLHRKNVFAHVVPQEHGDEEPSTHWSVPRLPDDQQPGASASSAAEGSQPLQHNPFAAALSQPAAGGSFAAAGAEADADEGWSISEDQQSTQQQEWRDEEDDVQVSHPYTTLTSSSPNPHLILI